MSAKRPIIIGAIVLLAALGGGVAFLASGRLLPSDCTSVEKYDFIRGSCYFECENENECDNLTEQVQAELTAYFEDSRTLPLSPTDKQPTSTIPGQLLTQETTGSETDGTVYTVQPDGSLAPTPNSSDEALWELFEAVVSKDGISRYVESFEVFDGEDDATAASVWQSDTLGKWHVNVNAAFADDRRDLIHTLIHEYGHIVSLNTDQVDGAVAGACPRFSLNEGCAEPDSYIEEFHKRFWRQYGDRIPPDDGANPDEVADFYERQPEGTFVSEYAATNPTEDFAETWADFVLRDRPRGSTTAERKILFMYEYAELLAERNRIRQAVRPFTSN